VHPATIFVNLGSIAFFQSRAFLTAWLSVMLIRFGPELPLLRNLEYLNQFAGVSSWLTHDLSLIVLGLLAVLEFLATKDDAARELLDEFDPYVKALMALLISFGIFTTADREVLAPLQQAGVPGNMLLSVLIAAATLRLALLRHDVLRRIHEFDADDSLGLQTLLSWLEDLWVMLGLLLLLLYPLFVLFVVAILWMLLLALRRGLQRREQSRQVLCPQCDNHYHASATVCPGCRRQIEQPYQIGIFGTAKTAIARDRAEHRLRLLASRRCPDCAAFLQQSSPHQQCTACGHAILRSDEQRQAYDRLIRRRLPQVLAVSTVLGLIPLLGMIIGIIYFRLQLVMPYSRYLPRFRRVGTKILLRLIMLVLIVLQLLPVAGAATVPLLALLSYNFYRRAFWQQFNS